jgi:hypothetical protein
MDLAEWLGSGWNKEAGMKELDAFWDEEGWDSGLSTMRM